MPEELKGGLNANQIKALKKKHNVGKLNLITVKTEEGETLFFWIKKPDMTILSAVSSLLEQNPMKACQVMFRNCLLKGEKKYANDVDVFPEIMKQLMNTIGKATSKLEKF